MKDLVSQDLSIGDNCYYINGENGQWVKVALVEVKKFKQTPHGEVISFIRPILLKLD